MNHRPIRPTVIPIRPRIDQSRSGVIPAKTYTTAITGHPITMVVRAICLIPASAVMSLSVSSDTTSSIHCDGNDFNTRRAAQLFKATAGVPGRGAPALHPHSILSEPVDYHRPRRLRQGVGLSDPSRNVLNFLSFSPEWRQQRQPILGFPDHQFRRVSQMRSQSYFLIR